jgi:hypothetical protein
LNLDSFSSILLKIKYEEVPVMKKQSIITAAILVCLLIGSTPCTRAGSVMQSLMQTLGIDKIPRKAVIARKLGLYPVFEHKKRTGKSRLYITPFAPVCVKAADKLAAQKAAGTVSTTTKAATVKVPIVDIQTKHQEKTVKIIDVNGNKNYATAFWETIKTKSKIYDQTIDTNFDGNLQIQVQCGSTIYTTTLGEGDKSPWDDGVTPLTDTFEKGKFIIKDQYWPGVTNKGPDGKIKTDVTLKMSWKPGLIQIQFNIKGPRNLPFLSDNTDCTSPVNQNDGDITVTINTFSIALVKDSGAGATVGTWSLSNIETPGKKKTKVQKKKIPDPLDPTAMSTGYYVLGNFNTKLKKEPLL